MENRLHVGQMLTAYIERKSLKRKDICRKLQAADSAIYSYEKRSSLQVSNLWELCQAMEYNFFADIAAGLPGSYGKGLFQKSATDDIIAQQAEEIKRLQWENQLMKELLGRK